jgi:transcriptional regulator GlxA family with amidase domain
MDGRSHPPHPEDREVIRVGLVALDGCLSVAVSGLIDAFVMANYWGKLHASRPGRRFSLQVLANRPGGVRGFAGYNIPVDGTLDSWSGGDVLICSSVVDPLRELAYNGELVEWLGEQGRRRDLTIASVCTGAFFLAEAGLLDGKKATTNPFFARPFAERYPAVRLDLARVIVDEGSVITAGTAASGLNLVFYLIERYAGVEVAVLAAKALSMDKNRSGQAPYLLTQHHDATGDGLVDRARRYIDERYADPGVSLARMASALATTERTLQRRFSSVTGESPMVYLRLVRLDAAKHLLVGTQASVDEVTSRIGYQDARAFARLFAAHVGVTPSAYRKRFGAAGERAGAMSHPAPILSPPAISRRR